MENDPQAYVVRPKPHYINRLVEFLESNRVAIGWPGLGSLEQCRTRDRLKDLLAEKEPWMESRSLGSHAGMINQFCNEMQIGDYVLVPNGGQVFIGRVKSEYKFDHGKVSEGWPHYREVEWLFDKQPVEKFGLDSKVVASLKGRSTVFKIWGDSVDKFVKANLIERYLVRLQKGEITEINDHTFIDFVCTVLQIQFPTLRSTPPCDKPGSPDLLAECVGKVKIFVKVECYDPQNERVTPRAVNQLADLMKPGDIGFVVTSGEYAEGTEGYAEKLASEQGKYISLITGRMLVELLFENLGQFSKDQLLRWGIVLS